MNGLFFGLNVVDIQYFIGTEISQNKKHRAIDSQISVGGPAVNAAITFTKLGGTGTYAGFIKGHNFSNWIVDNISPYNIIIKDLSFKNQAKPVFSSVVSSIDSGDRTIFYSAPKIYNVLISEDFLNNIDIVLLDGFYIKTAINIAKLAHKKKIPIVLDGGSWKDGMEDLLPYIDIAICSNDFKIPRINGTKKMITKLKTYGVNKIAFTRGEKPIIAYDVNQETQIPISATNVLDTLGAGDVFHGAFCYYWLDSNDFVTALRNASKIASFSCVFKGSREWLKYYNK